MDIIQFSNLFSSLYDLLYDGIIDESQFSLNDCDESIRENKQLYRDLCAVRRDVILSDREHIAFMLAAKIREGMND